MSDSAFGFEKAEDSPGYLLWLTCSSWQRRIRQALEPFGLAHAQFVLLAQLLWSEEQQKESSQAALVALSGLDKMTVSKACKKLVGEHYIVREELPSDTRSKQVTLTDAGRKIIRKAIPEVEKVDAEFFGKLNPEEHKSLLQALRKLS